MPRPKSSAHKFSITLPMGADDLLAELVKRKLYGESHSEVARYLIISALDELVQKGRLKELD
jgi:Arc/MetJ-type ribon-helix-helix transcriptional regulator